MKYIIGLIVGFIVGIILNILWKKRYEKYLPLEDAFLLKLICWVGYFLAGGISGALVASLNLYAFYAAVIILIIVLAVSYGFGIYYKTIATKNINI